MDINEQIFLVIEGAKFRKVRAKDACILCRTKETLAKSMGFHCNRKKKGKMPFRFFKKNIRLILNSF